MQAVIHTKIKSEGSSSHVYIGRTDFRSLGRQCAVQTQGPKFGSLARGVECVSYPSTGDAEAGSSRKIDRCQLAELDWEALGSVRDSV
jgi:hypothetical protein